MSNRESLLCRDEILARLEWPEEPVDLVLDTDTFNEIDDQFALVYTLLSPGRINLQAVTAAPFHNDRSSGPGDGMEKSHEEILRILEFMSVPAEGLAYRGATQWVEETGGPALSDASNKIIELARAHDERPLYVAAIGAITNVASALMAAPDIAKNIVVLWLGGHPTHWPNAFEFNMQGDPAASRHVLDCGVPLMLFPCALVAEKLTTTLPEMKAYADGKGRIGSYLYEIFAAYDPERLQRPGGSKVIWDLAPIAWVNNGSWCRSAVVASPVLTDELTWSLDPTRHPIREVVDIRRDEVYGDFFAKLAACAG